MRPTLEEISQSMNHASKLLGRIFNLELELTFKEFGYYESEDSQLPGMYPINWAMYYQGKFVEYSHMENPTDFNIGWRIGNEIHRIVNPSFIAEASSLTRKQWKKYGITLEERKEDPECALANAYRYVHQVIGICSGFTYARFRESIEENPLERVDRILSETWKEIAVGEETPDTPLKLAIFGEGQRVFQLTSSLYKKRGYHIISDLARLNLEEARAKILEYINVDILDLKE